MDLVILGDGTKMKKPSKTSPPLRVLLPLISTAKIMQVKSPVPIVVKSLTDRQTVPTAIWNKKNFLIIGITG